MRSGDPGNREILRSWDPGARGQKVIFFFAFRKVFVHPAGENGAQNGLHFGFRFLHLDQHFFGRMIFSCGYLVPSQFVNLTMFSCAKCTFGRPKWSQNSLHLGCPKVHLTQGIIHKASKVQGGHKSTRKSHSSEELLLQMQKRPQNA